MARPRSGPLGANQRRLGWGEPSPEPARRVARGWPPPQIGVCYPPPFRPCGDVMKFSFFPPFSPLFPSSCCAREGLEIGVAPQIPSPLPRCTPKLKRGGFGFFFFPTPSPRMALQRGWEGLLCARGGSRRARPLESGKLRATKHPLPPAPSWSCSARCAAPGCGSAGVQEKTQSGDPRGT